MVYITMVNTRSSTIITIRSFIKSCVFKMTGSMGINCSSHRRHMLISRGATDIRLSFKHIDDDQWQGPLNNSPYGPGPSCYSIL